MNPLDKRRVTRLPIQLELNVSNLFAQDNVKVDIQPTTISVFDVSKMGIGFKSTSTLPLNYYFNAKITLGDADNIVYTVVKIIRSQECEDGYIYGCEFVGLPDILVSAFEQYENQLNE